MHDRMTHLQRLEAEAIHIMREVVAEAENPVMLYSIGKDSSVMLHIAMKAFYPAKPPFPIMHIDTMWKFSEMIEFREKMAEDLGLDLIVHINPEGQEMGMKLSPCSDAIVRMWSCWTSSCRGGQGWGWSGNLPRLVRWCW